MLEDARRYHRDALRALEAAETIVRRCRQRGDVWALLDALWRLETAGRTYIAADNYLITLLVAPAPRRQPRHRRREDDYQHDELLIDEQQLQHQVA